MLESEKYFTLLELLKKGDERAFSEIYETFWEKLYFLAYQKLNDQESAEEVVQDVFLTLWRKREDLMINNLSHYLAAMVRYAVYRTIARESQSKKREMRFQDSQGTYFTIEESIGNKMLLDKIFELSNHLPERCRLVFQYNKLEDRSLDEVSELLGISKKTAETHLTKALKTIRLGLRSFLIFLF